MKGCSASATCCGTSRASRHEDLQARVTPALLYYSHVGHTSLLLLARQEARSFWLIYMVYGNLIFTACGCKMQPHNRSLKQKSPPCGSCKASCQETQGMG